MSDTSYELKSMKTLSVNVGTSVTPQNQLRAVISALNDHAANRSHVLWSVTVSYDFDGAATAMVLYET